MLTVSTQSPLAKVPALRLLVPFLMGIIAALTSDNILWPVTIFATGIIIYVALRLMPHTPAWSMRLRPFWIVPFFLILLATGWADAVINQPVKLDEKQRTGGLGLRIDDIDYNDKSMSIYARLKWVRGISNHNELRHRTNVLITTRGCNYTLQPGDIIGVEGRLEEIKSLGNPDGFDYASYMLDQGIRYRAHVDVNEIYKNSIDSEPTMTNRLNLHRMRLQEAVFATQLPAEVQSFIIATLLGNSRFITPETRAEFSAAGVSHMLALSGLHVGIIMGIVWFLLFPLNYLRMHKLRQALTIIIMFGYAAFTGFSPSVVRATVMMTMVLLGMIGYRKSVSLNALAIAALVLLAIYPRTIYSIGFQLSFTTVAALLLFFYHEKGKGRDKRPRVVRYIVQLGATSLVAMASTIMLTAYYFSSVSMLSVVGNILILPVFPIVMVLSVMFVLLCGVGIEFWILNAIIDAIYRYISMIARFTGETLPGHIDGVYITGADVVIYYIALGFVLLWYRRKEVKWLNYAIAMIAIIIAHGAYIKAVTPKRGFVIFNNFAQTQLLSFNGSKAMLWVPDGEADAQLFRQQNKKFIAHYGIKTIEVAQNGTHAHFAGKNIVCATGGRWKKLEAPAQRIETDMVVVTKKFSSDIEKLTSIYSCKLVVLSGDIYDEKARLLEKGCSEQDIHYYSIKSSGAYIEM